MRYNSCSNSFWGFISFECKLFLQPFNTYSRSKYLHFYRKMDARNEQSWSEILVLKTCKNVQLFLGNIFLCKNRIWSTYWWKKKAWLSLYPFFRKNYKRSKILLNFKFLYRKFMENFQTDFFEIKFLEVIEILFIYWKIWKITELSSISWKIP